MFRKILATALLCVGVLCHSSMALAQGAIQQSGPVTAFHAPAWVGNGIVADAGSPASPYVSALGLFDGAQCPFGVSSQTKPGSQATPASQFTICQTAATTTFNFVGVNGQAPPAVNFNIGGATYPFPGTGYGDVLGPSTTTVSHAVCFNNAGGTLIKDCGAVAANVMSSPYNAKCDGSTDDTAAIQAALNAGLSAVFVPPTVAGCKFTTLTMPVSVLGFTLFGSGSGSKLIQTGAGIKWPVNLGIDYHEEWISNLFFDGTNGSGHTIDTSYEGGVTLSNLYFNNVPTGLDAIHIDGSSTTYDHDVRVDGVQVFSSTAGRAFIGLGSHAADLSINNLDGNGEFAVQYGVYADNGALTSRFSNSHPYNLAKSVIYTAAGGQSFLGWSFDNFVFDNSLEDNVVFNNMFGTTITSSEIEATHAGNNGFTLNNSAGTTIVNLIADGAMGSGYIVNETGTTSQTAVIGGTSDAISNWTNPGFHFLDPNTSYAKSFYGYSPLGQQVTFVGTTASTVAGGSTVYLGVNGGQSTLDTTAFPNPLTSGHLLSAKIILGGDIGAGKSITFTLYRNLSAITAASGSANPVTISGNGVYEADIYVAQGAPDFVETGDQLYIKAVSSAGANSINIRYSINEIG